MEHVDVAADSCCCYCCWCSWWQCVKNFCSECSVPWDCQSSQSSPRSSSTSFCKGLPASMHISYAYIVSNAAKRDVDEAHATAQLVRRHRIERWLVWNARGRLCGTVADDMAVWRCCSCCCSWQICCWQFRVSVAHVVVAHAECMCIYMCVCVLVDKFSILQLTQLMPHVHVCVLSLTFPHFSRTSAQHTMAYDWCRQQSLCPSAHTHPDSRQLIMLI